MELTFIRHAQAASASPDAQLTELGRRQAECLAKASARWRKPAEVLVSPYVRARETAAPLCAAFGLEPQIAPWLEEIRAPGEAFDAFQARIRTGLLHELAGRGARPQTSAGPAKSWHIENPEHGMVLVGHGGANSLLVELVLGIETDPTEWYRFSFVHAAVTTLKAFRSASAWRFMMLRHGNVSHLPRELRSF